MGLSPKDIDLCVVCEFAAIKPAIESIGGKVFLEVPDHMTARCKIPGLGDVDIAVARVDGNYSDGRRPDSVVRASDIIQDLSRRDCTMNAMALNLNNGAFIDPFGGSYDIEIGVINAVGNARSRIKEDYLRALRYFRFGIVKNMELSDDIEQALGDEFLMRGLSNVSNERIRDELYRCFHKDTFLSLIRMNHYPFMAEQIFKSGSIWLKPTMEKRN
jgi:tRNA nucleotidyltransferase/poly(A) polymerase